MTTYNQHLAVVNQNYVFSRQEAPPIDSCGRSVSEVNWLGLSDRKRKETESTLTVKRASNVLLYLVLARVEVVDGTNTKLCGWLGFDVSRESFESRLSVGLGFVCVATVEPDDTTIDTSS